MLIKHESTHSQFTIMKKLFIITLVSLLGIAMMSSCSDDNDDNATIPSTELPSTAQGFLQSYCPGDEVVRAERKGHDAGTTYEVKLRSGLEIEFDALGEWIDVDAPQGRTIPNGIAPQPIVDFIAENYPSSGINEISRDYRGYEVELTNGLDLVFNPEGSFIGIDR